MSCSSPVVAAPSITAAAYYHAGSVFRASGSSSMKCAASPSVLRGTQRLGFIVFDSRILKFRLLLMLRLRALAPILMSTVGKGSSKSATVHNGPTTTRPVGRSCRAKRVSRLKVRTGVAKQHGKATANFRQPRPPLGVLQHCCFLLRISKLFGTLDALLCLPPTGFRRVSLGVQSSALAGIIFSRRGNLIRRLFGLHGRG